VVGTRCGMGWLVVMIAVCVAGFIRPAAGQQAPSAFIQQQRAVEEHIREELNEQAPPTQRAFELDWGGWYSFFLFLYDDGIESSRTLRRHDLRLWTRLRLDQGVHEGYARVRLSYLDFNTGDSFDGDDNDWEGPNLDRGFYQLDVAKALEVYGQKRVPFGLKFKIGRDYVEFGTGYALSLPLDHILLTGEMYHFELTGLIGRTVRSLNNVDRTRPGEDESDRNFWGVQLAYNGFEQHRPFVYVLWNEDQLREAWPDPFQNYDYDSFYVGFGSSGQLVRNLRYSTEWVFEKGRSYGDRQIFKRDPIHAWGFDLLLEYLWDVPTKPTFSFEYMFASGDPDRLLSPTDARGGNTKGDDTSFVAFGYRDTGLSFAPDLSNVHIWRFGLSFFPFEKVRALRRLELGSDWFLYWKNRSHAAVSDPLADQASGYLGWEMDYFANWRLTSDVALTLRYGLFFPGSAFSDQTTRPFFLTGVSWNF